MLQALYDKKSKTETTSLRYHQSRPFPSGWSRPLTKGWRRSSYSSFVGCLILAFLAVCLVLYSIPSVVQTQLPSRQLILPGEPECLSSGEVGFLRLAEDLELRLFVVDAGLLVQSLTLEEKSLLLRRNIPNYTRVKSPHLRTFGIMEKDDRRFNQSVIAEFEKRQFIYGHVVVEDARRMHWDPSKSYPGHFITAHRFLRRGSLMIHLIVFFPRGEYFWLGPAGLLLGNMSLWPIRAGDLLFGGHPAALDRFELVRAHTLCLSVLVPDDPLHFLLQVPSSRFLECSFQASRAVHSMFPKETLTNKEKLRKFVQGLREMKEKMRVYELPFWICSGTLLGWYRQCDIIPYTSDVDFATWAKYYDQRLLSSFSTRGNKLRVRYTYGLAENSLQLALYREGLRFDLFFTYENENNTWYVGHHPKKSYFNYTYPRFQLCSAEMVNQKVLVPCNPEAMIRVEYGVNWSIPVTGWNYDSSAFNIGPTVTWGPNINTQKIYKAA